MPVSVVNSVSTIVINDGGSEIAVSKELVRVGNYGDNVTIQWSPTEYRTFLYTDFTAPTGASADAVKDAIEAFLDSGISVTVTLGGQFAEDSAATSGETGLSILAVRNDTIGTALTSADGDYSWLAVDSAGRLGIRSNFAEDASHTTGDIGNFILAVRDDAMATVQTSTTGDYSPITVDSVGRVGTRDNKVEDALHTTGDIGSFILGVRNDTITTALTSTNGDYSPIAVDSAGRVGIRSNYAYDTLLAAGDIGSFILGLRQDGISSVAVPITDTDGDYSPITVDSLGRVGTRDNKVEDDVHTNNDIGSFILGVRNDSNAARTGADGDYSPISVDSTGRLKVILAANSGVDIGDVDVLSVIPGTGATNLGKAIDTATGATDTGVLALATRDDALSALTPIEGDNVQLRTDANGALWTHDDALDAALAGSELQVDVVAALPAGTNNIGDVDVLSIIPGTGATNLGKAEDAVHANGDTGVMALAVRNEAITTLTTLDGDYSPMAVDDAGRLMTADQKFEDGVHTSGQIGSFILGVRNDTITTALTSTDGDYSPIAVDSAGKIAIRSHYAEDAAHTTADIGNFILAVRNDTITTALTSTDGDYSPVAVDSAGRVGTRDNKAEDVAHSTGDIGSFILGVRNDAFAALSGTDGDYTPIGVDSAGRVGLSAGELFLGAIGGRTIIANGSFTRPADTTAYTANDVICNSTTSPTIITFNVARLTSGATGRSGVIQSATLVDSANETLKLDGDLFLFDTTVTMDNDNAAFTPTDGELATCVAVITFSGGTARSGTAGTGGNCAYPNALGGGIPFVCLTENQLYGIFVARNAYIPISAEVFTFRLGILQD